MLRNDKKSTKTIKSQTYMVRLGEKVRFGTDSNIDSSSECHID